MTISDHPFTAAGRESWREEIRRKKVELTPEEFRDWLNHEMNVVGDLVEERKRADDWSTKAWQLVTQDLPKAHAHAEWFAAERESTYGKLWWWLSFVDPDKTDPDRDDKPGFLGACIVHASSVAEGAREAWRLEINPGGAVSGFPLHPTEPVPTTYLNRWIPRDEALMLVERDGWPE